MSFLFLGFLTGLTLIFAVGPQNVFVIEQGLKKQYIFLVCLLCFQIKSRPSTVWPVRAPSGTASWRAK